MGGATLAAALPRFGAAPPRAASGVSDARIIYALHRGYSSHDHEMAEPIAPSDTLRKSFLAVHPSPRYRSPMAVRTLSQLRAEIIKRVSQEHREPVGHLIDALAAWSEAAGLRHDPPTGADPVIRFRVEGGSVAVWAIYPSEAKGGAKLSLVPGLTDHPQGLRDAARELTSSSEGTGNFDGKKLDMSLSHVATRSSWTPVFHAMSAALEYTQHRT